MLISSRFLSVVIVCIHSAVSSEILGDVGVNRRNSKQVQAKTNTYKYNHPPVPEANDTPTTPIINSEARGNQNLKAIEVLEQSHSGKNRTRVRTVRRRIRPNLNTRSDLEIPVKVIYDVEPTTLRSNIITTKSSRKNITPAPNQRKRQRHPNTNKNIDIREVNIDQNFSTFQETVTSSSTERQKFSTAPEFPKRSRESFFKKQPDYRVPEPNVKIIEEKNFVYAHNGNFHYSFVGEDGTKVSSEGELRSIGNDKPGEAVSGSVYYKDKDGNDVNLSYTADENGYRPVGAHLPTPPPVPLAIARALKYIAEKNKSTTPSGQHWFSADNN